MSVKTKNSTSLAFNSLTLETFILFSTIDALIEFLAPVKSE